MRLSTSTIRTAIAMTAGALAPLAPVLAHEVDEYIQSTLISLEKDHLDVQMRLVPGVDVFPQVLAQIDRNRDGLISDAEKQAYARAVLRDLTFSMNGRRAAAEIVSAKFPSIELMNAGLGEIQLALHLPVTNPSEHQKLVLENRHQPTISAYLVNCLKPLDPSVHIVSQHRSADQSRYELNYETGG